MQNVLQKICGAVVSYTLPYLNRSALSGMLRASALKQNRNFSSYDKPRFFTRRLPVPFVVTAQYELPLRCTFQLLGSGIRPGTLLLSILS
jgi:hypothetical protein